MRKVSIAEKNFDRLESLNELYEAIEMGLDIEFVLYEKRYNISWRNHKPFICICPDGDAEFYKDTDDLLNNHCVNGIPIKKLWKDFAILSM